MIHSDSVNAAPSYLKGLDYSVVQQCMHCGLCLPTCPTYDATKLERHSPRGRISLMRAIADDRLVPSQVFGDEMYFCLGCLACMSACPAGVDYARLFESARAEVERTGLLRSPKRSLIRGFTVAWLFMDLERLLLAGRFFAVVSGAWTSNRSPSKWRAEAAPQAVARAGGHHTRHPEPVFRGVDRADHPVGRAEAIPGGDAGGVRPGPDLQRR